MFRDKTPLVNLGYGVTSRDIPAASNEEKNPNPNSGFIARALDDKPIIKYLTTTAGTLAATYAASKLLSRGGIKLAKTIQKSADSGSQLGRTFVQNATQIRKALDSYEGVNRYVEGVTDPYSRLIYQSADGSVVNPQLTRLGGPDFVSDGTMWMTRKEFKAIRAGRQPVAEWGYRDELQSRLARGARSLPLMLPSTYLVQRGLTDQLFGNSDDKGKIKWYNPVDVVTDFVRQSTLNMTNILLPDAVAGASVKRLSQLANAPYQDFPLPLSRNQLKTANKIADIKTILMSFGQDSSKIIQQATRISSSATYAFNTAFNEAQRSEGGIAFALGQARRGAAAARKASEDSGEGKLTRASRVAKGYLFGYSNKSGSIIRDIPKFGDFGISEKTLGFIDTIPTLKGFTVGSREFKKQFKNSTKAYDVISGALSFDEALRGSGGNVTEAADILSKTIGNLRRQHTSRFSNLVKDSLAARTRLDPDGQVKDVGSFTEEFERNAYSLGLQQALVRRGIERDSAIDFVGGININQLLSPSDRTRSISERITYGIKKINVENNNEFFEAVAERAKKDLGEKGKSFNSELLQSAFREADAPFTSEVFRDRLRKRAESAFSSSADKIITRHADLISRPQKALYEHFTGEVTPNKMEFLSRKVAQKLAVKLVESDGTYTSAEYIRSELAKRGLDSTDASQLRGFLVDNKLMTPASNMGGFNIFGLKEISIDQAFDRGIFESFDDSSRAEARRLYGQVALQDPVSKSIGYSALTGVYETASGRIVDTTRVRSTARSFLNSLTDGYRIPIVKFNPLQLLGFGGPKGVDQNQEIQFLRGSARQDFVAGKANRPDVYAWVNQSSGIFGNVGKLFGITADSDSGKIEEFSGMFKRFSSIETDLYSRAGRLASGRQQERNSVLSGEPISRLEKIKSLFDLDEEQPGSLFRKFSRFTKRKEDIQNSTFFSRLLAESTVKVKKGKTLSLIASDSGPIVVDEAGQTVFDPSAVAKAFDSFREQQTSRRGTPLPVIAKVEEKLQLRKLNIKGIDTSLSEVADEDLLEAVTSLENIYGIKAAEIRASGKDPIGLTRAMKFVTNISEETSLSTDLIKHRSPTISTRQDYLRNAINKVLIEIKTYDDYSGDPSQMAVKLEEVLQSMKRQGTISADQLAEARAAALENIFDLFSYQSYKPAIQFGKNQQNALLSILKKRDDSPEFAEALVGLTKPFTSQTISNVGATGTGRLSAIIRPTLKRNFGAAPYELSDNSVNPLGNARTTFIPTFTSQLDRATRGETTFRKVLANTVGLNSYDSPDTFSSASIPAIHLSDRLNRYFEKVGLSVDSDKYKSPLSFFAKGIVGKRVAPLYVGGALVLGADRTIGGLTEEKDARGERVYSPFFLSKAARGAVEVQSVASGITPGGMGYEEKKEQLLEGEVPVRQGRYWPLGTTPFAGSKVQYYRPSYYRRMKSGSTYTSDAFGSPVERLAYGYDFSPLRPFDPYRFERENYFDRPYPVTGEYFTGPFGPITPALNMTVGRLLKPQVPMHQQEVSQALSQYVPAGYGGAFDPSGLISSGRVTPTYSGGISAQGVGQSGPQRTSGSITGLQIGTYNNSLAGAAGQLNTARDISYSAIASANQGYTQAIQYGAPPVPGYIPPQIVPTGAPISMSTPAFQKTELGYRVQEMAGIYGFGFSSLKETFGFGSGDLQPNVAVLQSASKAYGSTRSFWDLNLGGLGDVPASESTLELSEIARRFIPKERTDISYLNPIKNTMGAKYPFLPGSDYFINFQTGDPFAKIQEGELRLPGVSYERLNPLRRDYESPVTQLDILADVAPYSRQFRSLDRTLNMGNLDPSERAQVQNIRAQVEQTTKRNQFSPYKYKHAKAEELGISRSSKAVGQMGEYLAHRDTFINTKFSPNRTAQEDWERRNVYGNSFPEWSSPIESFIKPIYYKSTQRNPLTAGLITAGIGALFGTGPKERAIGALFGLTTGMAFSAFSNTKEVFTGERFIPKERKKQMALEEYTDILSYVKNKSLATQASQAGDMASANQFNQAAKRTMYGADLYGSSVDSLSLAIPKRKREHFKEMIQAPVQERESILSTAPRLERRIYQAAWGMPVEEKPDLTEFFSRHELPDLSWEGWHPNTNMDHIKIKMGQSMGINMSQMGYYPQQIREANLTNPSYPSFAAQENPSAAAAKLRMLMTRNGISGSVMPVQNNNGQSSINISAGIL